eukprot:GHVP01025681.1.p1 GENE.GHVP01025681.1~~GHVP01025681.1.p1  ORF type:complete len:347 (+),score=67.08 GHVP01025681.1:32-1072(+)
MSNFEELEETLSGFVASNLHGQSNQSQDCVEDELLTDSARRKDSSVAGIYFSKTKNSKNGDGNWIFVPNSTKDIREMSSKKDVGVDLGKNYWASRSEFDNDRAAKEESCNLKAYKDQLVSSKPLENFRFIRNLSVEDVFFFSTQESQQKLLVEGASNENLQICGGGQMEGFTKGFTSTFGKQAKEKFNKMSESLTVKGNPLNILAFNSQTNCLPYLTQGPNFNFGPMTPQRCNLLQSSLHSAAHFVDSIKVEDQKPLVHFRAKLCGGIFRPSTKADNDVVEQSVLGSCFREAIEHPDVLVTLICDKNDYPEFHGKIDTLYTCPFSWQTVFSSNPQELKKFKLALRK